MSKLRIAGIVFTVIAASFWIGTCVLSSGPGNNHSPSPHLPSPTVNTVRYEITGTAETVDVTLGNATGGCEQYSDVYLPRTFTYYDYTDNFVYISAQNNGETGSVTVTIYVNDKLYKTSTSSGAFVIADASGGI
jgi:hypothetical protein